MYAEEGSGGCYYHPGTHRGDGNHGRTGLMCGWSCCKELAEDAQGCRLASQHTSRAQRPLRRWTASQR